MAEAFDHLLEKYARLVVGVGVNVQPGQPVVIWSLPEQAAVARALAEECYRVGASKVTVKYDDPHVQRAAVLHAPEETLGVISPQELEEVRSWEQTRPALIRLTGNPNPTLMDGLDPDRLAKSAPTELLAQLFPLISTSHIAWTIVGAPTPGWAASVGAADVAALWEAVATAMRLDEADPVKAWRRHIEKLRRRADALNEQRFDKVRYQGPGTDITIGVAPESVWTSAEMTSSDGVTFVPNMPTEEVFMSPDWRRAEGTVRTSAPFFLNTMGAMVEGLELEFRDGTITGARASRGEAEVQKQFELIPRSRHLGEVAIVDRDSKVAETGLVYKDMLYDENVGSHIAWGAGFAFAFEGAKDQTPDERIASGLNQSNTHVDVVIGSPEVQIDGIRADGSVVPVTRGDEFVLPV